MSKPIYIFVTPYFPTEGDWSGGYGYDFVRALLRTKRFDVVVIKPEDGPDCVYAGIRIFRFKPMRIPGDVLPMAFSRQNGKAFLAALRRAGIAPEEVSVCHCNNACWGVVLDALKEKNPNALTLVHHHDLASFGLMVGRLRHWWIHKLLTFFPIRSLNERVDWHVFISERCRKSFLSFPDTRWSVYENYRKLGRGLSFLRSVRIRNSYVLHNGVDVSVFKKVQGKKPNDVFTIGCVAHFEQLKDQISLLRAMKTLQTKRAIPLRAIFVGTGPELAFCRRYSEENGLDVEFRTEVRHEKLADFYRTLDLFVLPSYFEGFGCVYTEAWACGVPFIACEGQGIEDVIPEEERAFWLAKPQNPDDLAQKIWYYIQKRPEQHLTESVDINVLVNGFVDRIFDERAKR